MDKETFRALNRGDIIRHKTSSESHMVMTSNYRSRVTVVDVMDITNPDEWDLIYKASYNKPTCKNCQDPRPGKMIYVVDKGGVTYCEDCGRLMFPEEE